MTQHHVAFTAASPRRRVALYGHDTLGLGHLRRNLAIAGALTAERPAGAGWDVLVLTGASEASLFAVPHGVETLIVPGIRKNDDGTYWARMPRRSLGAVLAMRESALRAALVSDAPDLLIVDKAPWGFGGELTAALRMLKAGGTRLVLGLRDVLDDPAVAAEEWHADDGDRAVAELYDEVWVYGDERVHDVVAACRMGRVAAERTRHLGYLAPPHRDSDRNSQRDSGYADHRPLGDTPYVLVTVGGGQDGAALVRAAAHMTTLPGVEVVILSGPQAADRDRGMRPRQGVHVHRFSPHAMDWLRGAEAVIAMGGANTVAELLTTDVPALIVPRVTPRREQLVRAIGLQRQGALDTLVPELLSPERLSDWVRARLGTRIYRSHLRCDGLDQVRAHAERLVAGVSHVPA